jgi:hypothetical protein
MTNFFHWNDKFTTPCVLLLCWGASAVADGFDIRILELDDYTYPESQTVDKRQEQTYAKLILLSHDSPAAVVQFYENIGLKLGSGADDGDTSNATPGRIVFEKHMVAAHAPLSVVVLTNGSDSHNLDDNDLYHDLKVYVATGVRTQNELDAARQRFDGLKQRFFESRPTSSLKECRSSMGDSSAKQEESMEERGRRMQELAMQGRMDELRMEMENFGQQTGSIDDVAADRWDAEIECLEKLERDSFPVRIEVIADRDDLLG